LPIRQHRARIRSTSHLERTSASRRRPRTAGARDLRRACAFTTPGWPLQHPALTRALWSDARRFQILRLAMSWAPLCVERAEARPCRSGRCGVGRQEGEAPRQPAFQEDHEGASTDGRIQGASVMTGLFRNHSSAREPSRTRTSSLGIVSLPKATSRGVSPPPGLLPP
jgi:hypothetical protein